MRIVRGCSRVCRIGYAGAIPAGFWGGMRCETARAAEPSGKFQPPTYTFLHTVARGRAAGDTAHSCEVCHRTPGALAHIRYRHRGAKTQLTSSEKRAFDRRRRSGGGALDLPRHPRGRVHVHLAYRSAYLDGRRRDFRLEDGPARNTGCMPTISACSSNSVHCLPSTSGSPDPVISPARCWGGVVGGHIQAIS